MRNTIISVICLLCVAGIASAQNIDPTVEVSRVYEGRLIDSHKPFFRMAVPDSVEKFDLKFDYSVADSPYKGTDSFKPYFLDLRPDASPYTGKTLFLRAGAGYSLHPVADVVWSPKFKVPFRMSIYGHHRSYVGNYRDILTKEVAPGRFDLLRDGKSGGYETETSAGVNGRTDWNGGFFTFDAGYFGIAAKYKWQKRHYDAVRTGFRVASLTDEERHFHYDVNLAYSYGEDFSQSTYSPQHPDPYWFDMHLKEHDLALDATLGPVLSKEHGILVDVGLALSAYSGYLSSYAGDFSLTPRYVLRKGRWSLDLGVKLAVLFSNDATSNAMSPMHTFKGQYVYPAIDIDFEAIRGYLDIYLKVDGGNDINRYSGLLERNRHLGDANFSFMYSRYLDNTVNRVTASLGFRGNISSRFGYDLSAGYSNMANDVLWGIHLPESHSENHVGLHPILGYASYQRFFTELECGWHSEDFRLDAMFAYSHSWGAKVHHCNQPTPSKLFLMPEFRMGLNAVYNWKKRIYVGLHCEAASASKDVPVYPEVTSVMPDAPVFDSVRLPGWVDLGLSAEYRFTRRLSFWLYGGNLLNMTVQRIPLYAESGINCTLGVTFNL